MSPVLASMLEVPGDAPPPRRGGRRWLLIAAPLAFLLVFFAAPLFQNLVRSLQAMPAEGGQAVFSLAQYVDLLTDTYYLSIIFATVKMSLVTTVLCLIFGFPIAYYMVRRGGRWTMVMLFLLVTPLLTSIIMRTFGWRVLFARRGLVNNLLMDWGWIETPLRLLDGMAVVYTGLVHVTIPFMVLSIIPVLRGIDTRLEESSRVLGASALRTFFSVTLPLSKEGIVTGSVLVFMLTMGSFVTQLLLGNGQAVNLPLLIFQQFSLTQNVNLAAAMGNLLLLIVLSCLLIQMRLTRTPGGHS